MMMKSSFGDLINNIKYRNREFEYKGIDIMEFELLEGKSVFLTKQQNKVRVKNLRRSLSKKLRKKAGKVLIPLNDDMFNVIIEILNLYFKDRNIPLTGDWEYAIGIIKNNCLKQEHIDYLIKNYYEIYPYLK